MNGIIMLSAILAFALVALVVGVRYTRRNEPSPGRREFNRLRKSNQLAVKALNDVDDVLDSYQLAVDEVGRQLILDVKAKIKEHDRMRMELEK